MIRMFVAALCAGLFVVPAAAQDAPAPVPAPCLRLEGRPQLMCDGASCIRVPVAELCRRYRSALQHDPAVLQPGGEEDARHAMTRLVASVR